MLRTGGWARQRGWGWGWWDGGSSILAIALRFEPERVRGSAVLACQRSGGEAHAAATRGCSLSGDERRAVIGWAAGLAPLETAIVLGHAAVPTSSTMAERARVLIGGMFLRGLPIVDARTSQLIRLVAVCSTRSLPDCEPRSGNPAAAGRSRGTPPQVHSRRARQAHTCQSRHHPLACSPSPGRRPRCRSGWMVPPPHAGRAGLMLCSRQQGVWIRQVSDICATPSPAGALPGALDWAVASLAFPVNT